MDLHHVPVLDRTDDRLVGRGSAGVVVGAEKGAGAQRRDCRKEAEKRMTEETKRWVEFWTELCKTLTPDLDNMCKTAEGAGMKPEKMLHISVRADGYASLMMTVGEMILDCTALGDEEYKLSIFDTEKERFRKVGTIPRAWDGGKSGENAQSDQERQEDKPWRNEMNTTREHMTG